MDQKIVHWTVVDADAREKFVTESWESREHAERRRNELVLKYGKEFCLEVWGIDAAGDLVEVPQA